MHTTTPPRRRRVLPAGIAAALTAVLVACGPVRDAPTVAPAEPPIDTTRAVTVGLLVPLGSGDAERERIGRSLVNAARLAESDLRGAAIDLRVYESRGSSSGGAEAARQAVADGVDIIVGPLFSTETAAAADIAEQAGLTMLSFSNNPAVAGGNVYLLGLTYENTANRLISYAAGQGLTNLAVVYPRGLDGETARDAVRAAAPRFGATLVATEGYELSVEGIERRARPIADRLRATGANAVILTDGPTGGLPFISESLRGLGVSAEAAQFMGLQRWDISAEAIRQPALQGGLFAAADRNILNTFRARYRNAYGQDPHELAGLAYDGIAAVGAMIRAGGANAFSTAQITTSAGFAGVNGPFRFLPSGNSERMLAIYEVEDGQARIIDPAPRSFVPLVN